MTESIHKIVGAEGEPLYRIQFYEIQGKGRFSRLIPKNKSLGAGMTLEEAILVNNDIKLKKGEIAKIIPDTY